MIHELYTNKETFPHVETRRNVCARVNISVRNDSRTQLSIEQ